MWALLAPVWMSTPVAPTTPHVWRVWSHVAPLRSMLRARACRWGPYTPVPSHTAALLASLLCWTCMQWGPDLHMQHQIYFCNIQMKHMQHSDETYIWNAWNVLRLLMKTLATWSTCCNIHRWNIWNIRLQHMCRATATYATYRKNTCNIRLKQMKHLKHILTTYVYSHCNI
jgi:hypothetical protein